ncbi:MAG: hypothetical protein NZ534_06540, partial [Bacteroidia bacterium]|nr:hypothetical protein [Bacteroidia bacterium]
MMFRGWWLAAAVGALLVQGSHQPFFRRQKALFVPGGLEPAFDSRATSPALARIPRAVKLVRDKINAFRWAAKPENTHPVCDRAVYHPGDSIYFAVFAYEHTRFAVPYSERLYVALVGPHNDTVFKRPLTVGDGLAWGAAQLPYKLAPAVYRLVAFTEWMRRNNRPYGVRPVVVMPVRTPPLRLYVRWEKERFFFGENVEARLYVKIFDQTGEEERAWARKSLSAVWRDGRVVLHEESLTTDDFGVARIKYAPPQTLLDLSLTLKVEFDGVTDEVRYPVPYCNTRMIYLKFFPEGGKMFAGLKNRVAFKATYADGSPAQVAGDVVRPDGRVVARFETLHAGMGEFFVECKEPVQLTAQLKIPQPSAAVKAFYPLPPFAQSGHYIHFQNGNFLLAATRPEKVVFCIVMRDSVYFARQIHLYSAPRLVRWKAANVPAGLAV